MVSSGDLSLLISPQVSPPFPFIPGGAKLRREEDLVLVMQQK